jgi:hypothetical protein
LITLLAKILTLWQYDFGLKVRAYHWIINEETKDENNGDENGVNFAFVVVAHAGDL